MHDNNALAEYVTEHFARPDAALRQIEAEIPRRGLPAITITAEEGRFLQCLTRLAGGQRVVEIGALGGYSGAWIARGLAPGGRLITLELEPHHAAVAREHFALAGVADRVEVRVGNAHDLLPGLAAEGPFDLCFIDAEKGGYDRYLDWALAHVRPGGVIAAHNAFWNGEILAEATDASTLALQRFNRRFAAEPRLLGTIYPAGDGILFGVVA